MTVKLVNSMTQLNSIYVNGNLDSRHMTAKIVSAITVFLRPEDDLKDFALIKRKPYR